MNRLVVMGAAILVAVAIRAEPVAIGHWKTIDYDQPDLTPVVFGGECRTKEVRAVDCCVYLDITHADGSVSYSVRTFFDQGTHGWQKSRRVWIPKKPVRKIEAYVLCRTSLDGGDIGTAEFRNVYLERRAGVQATDGLPEPFPPRTSPLAKGSFRVWTTDSLRRVTPYDFPADVAASRLAFDVAARGAASAQVHVSTAVDLSLADLDLRFDPMKDAEGRPLDGRLIWQRVAYLKRTGGYQPHPLAPPTGEPWIPDPLLPAAPFGVRRGSTQSLWVTVAADPAARKGLYRGEARIVAKDGAVLGRIPVEVRVRGFSQPETFGLETSFSLMDGYLRQQYPRDWRRMKKRAIDVLLDHRVNPDDISRTQFPEIEDLLHQRARGMNRFTVLNIVPEPEDTNALWTCYAPPEATFNPSFYPSFKARLAPYVERLRANGLMKHACLYGFDERGEEYYAGIADLCEKLKADFPDLPVLTTSTLFRDYAKDRRAVPTDIFCPCSNVYDVKAADELRAGGRKVWWYTCCGPWAPHANMASYEFPPIEGRILLGFMTYHAKADGFLFWHVNFWLADGNAPFDARDTYLSDWSTRVVSSACAGDGVFLYPGLNDIYPTIRLAQIRDGVQDYEWLKLLESRKGRPAAEAYCRELMTSFTSFTRDPERMLSVRRRLGDTLEGQ